MKETIYNNILAAKELGNKLLAVLVDPDSLDEEGFETIAKTAEASDVDYIFIGGSLLSSDNLRNCIEVIKSATGTPVVIFPGSPLQIDGSADGILFLSLISGRNPELLIGNHVISAPYLKSTNLEILPVGYMLIDSGRPTTASYMSNSNPIPYNKPEIAACTAMAGEMLGLKLIYMDGGSGATKVISEEMISKVQSQIEVPLIVGGGINTIEKAKTVCDAGADLIVIGNATEENPYFIREISEAIKVKKSNGVSSSIEP